MKKIDRLKRIANNILHWTWTKAVLYWIIFSAGTMSELAFLLASMWMSENSAAHDFVRQFMTEEMTKHLSWFATAAYVGLPVAILPLALLTVLTHARTWLYDRTKRGPFLWCLLYGIPTVVFLSLDIITVACSVLSVNFELPPYLIVARALSAYMFGIIALIYMRIGTEQEADRLKEKDLSISQLQKQIELLYAEKQEQIRRLTLQIEKQSDELLQTKMLLSESQNQQISLQNEIKKGTDDALQAYGEDCVNWLYSGLLTATVDDINRYTGHSKQKIVKAKLRRSSRNADLIVMKSLVEWLKETPPPAAQLHIVNG